MCLVSSRSPDFSFLYLFLFYYPQTFSRGDCGMRSEILPLDFGCGDFFFTARGCISRLRRLRFVPLSPHTGFWCKIKFPGLLGTKQGAGFSSLFRLVSSRGRSHGNAACLGKIVKEIPFSSQSAFRCPDPTGGPCPPAAGRTDCLLLQLCVCVHRAMPDFFSHSMTLWFGLHRRIRRWRQQQSAAR